MNYVLHPSALMMGPFHASAPRFRRYFRVCPSPLLQALPAIFISWYRKVPLVVWVQDLWPESLAATGFVRNGTVLRWVAGVVRFLYRHTDLILVPSASRSSSR